MKLSFLCLSIFWDGLNLCWLSEHIHFKLEGCADYFISVWLQIYNARGSIIIIPYPTIYCHPIFYQQIWCTDSQSSCWEYISHYSFIIVLHLLTYKNPITNLATLAIDIFSLWYPKFVKSSKDVKNACQKAWGGEGGYGLGWGRHGRTLAQGGLRRGKLIKSLKRTNVLRRH